MAIRTSKARKRTPPRSPRRKASTLDIAAGIVDAIRRGPQKAARVPTTTRVTFSLPRGLASNIAMISKRFNVSQSAFISLLMEEGVEMLSKLVAMLPPEGTALDAKGAQRLRGSTTDYLRAQIAQLVEQASSIDPGLKL